MKGTPGQLPRSFINYNNVRKSWRAGGSVFSEASQGMEYINNLETFHSGINYQNYLYFMGI